MHLSDVTGRVRVHPPRSWQNIQVFPLEQPDDHPPTYTLIDDLLATHAAEITELDDGGQVPTIKVKNSSDKDALILDRRQAEPDGRRDDYRRERYRNGDTSNMCRARALVVSVQRIRVYQTDSSEQVTADEDKLAGSTFTWAGEKAQSPRRRLGQGG